MEDPCLRNKRTTGKFKTMYTTKRIKSTHKEKSRKISQNRKYDHSSKNKSVYFDSEYTDTILDKDDHDNHLLYTPISVRTDIYLRKIKEQIASCDINSYRANLILKMWDNINFNYLYTEQNSKQFWRNIFKFEIVYKHSDRGYHGTMVIIWKWGNQFIRIHFGYGSCSGCDPCEQSIDGNEEYFERFITKLEFVNDIEDFKPLDNIGDFRPFDNIGDFRPLD